jgi:hypothetical protein
MIDGQERRTLPSAIERLRAPGPFAPDKHQLMLYGRLIGAWDIDWVAFDEAGEAIERRRGEWHFAWVLGGRGVQDVIWTVGAPPEQDGTTLRCWDAQLGAWRVVFMSPGDREFVTLVGRPEGDRIVQEVIDRPPDAAASGGRSLKSPTPSPYGRPKGRATAGAHGPSRMRCAQPSA